MGYSPTSCLLYLSLGFVYFIPFLLMENMSEICLCGKGEDGRVDDIKFVFVGKAKMVVLMTLSFMSRRIHTHQEGLFFFHNEKEEGRGKCGASHIHICTKDTNMQSLCCVGWKTVFCCQQSFCGCSYQNV